MSNSKLKGGWSYRYPALSLLIFRHFDRCCDCWIYSFREKYAMASKKIEMELTKYCFLHDPGNGKSTITWF